jgi:hypothetical protein
MDPAGGKFGIVGIAVNPGAKLNIDFSFLIQSPEDFKANDKNVYVTNAAAVLAALYKPDIIVSENPFGIGWSAQMLHEIVGQLKANFLNTINWQRVSEARRAVLGDGYGGAKKRESTEWLLEYDWDISSKRLINKWLSEADPNSDIGYDLLDALMHGVCYLVANNIIVPVHKPVKKVKPKVSKKDKV